MSKFMIKVKESKLVQMLADSIIKNLNEKDIRNRGMRDKITLKRFANEEKKVKKKVVQALQEEGGVKIVNAEGTRDDHPENTTTWKAFWEEETGVKLEDILDEKDGKFLCPGHKHHENDDGYVEAKEICGCHVQKADAQGNIIDDTMYITPMCSGCNQRNDVFQIGKKAIVKRYRN